jgi:site-specific recombinase XerD
MAKLLDRVRERVRTLHYSIRTEDAYVQWIKRFILSHGKRHPHEMGAPDLEALLTHLGVQRDVAASTQNQALCAILFLYGEVLGRPLEELGRIAPTRCPERLPTVLTRDEVRSVLAQLDGTTWPMSSLLYGSGLRLLSGTEVRPGSSFPSPNAATPRQNPAIPDNLSSRMRKVIHNPGVWAK